MKDFTVHIRGLVWNVRFVSSDIIKQSMNGQDSFGYSHYSALTIFLDEAAEGDVLKSTFWHEICHAIVAPIIGSKFYEKHQAIDEELMCNLIGDGLTEILKQDLPEFIF